MTIVKPDLANPIIDFYPQPPDQPQGWGITFMLTMHETATGRGRNAAFWAGLPNVFWWCDREKGVAGIIATQILPFADEEVLSLGAKLESIIYADLEEGEEEEEEEGEVEVEVVLEVEVEVEMDVEKKEEVYMRTGHLTL